MAEDMDLTWTVYEAGHKVRFLPDAVSYPIEPHDYAFISKQLRRWSHGFVQNVRLHKRSLLRLGYLRSIVAVAFWDALLASLAYLVLIPALAIAIDPLILIAYLRAIGRQLAQALAMVAAVDLTLRLTYVALLAAGIGNPPAADEATVLPLNLIGITTGLLVLVLCCAKLAELVQRARSGELPRVPEALPRVAPLRALALAAVVTVAWLALLATGASELSPLERPERDQIASGRERDANREPRQADLKPRPEGRADRPPIAIEAADGGRDGTAVTPSGAAAPDSSGRSAETAPSTAVPTPEPPSPKPLPQPSGSAPVAIPDPQAAPPPTPPSEPQGAGKGPPESAGPPEEVSISEGAAPPAEPPPQAPAKGLRGS
jgi:hypothetical protein